MATIKGFRNEISHNPVYSRFIIMVMKAQSKGLSVYPTSIEFANIVKKNYVTVAKQLSYLAKEGYLIRTKAEYTPHVFYTINENKVYEGLKTKNIHYGLLIHTYDLLLENNLTPTLKDIVNYLNMYDYLQNINNDNISEFIVNTLKGYSSDAQIEFITKKGVVSE